MKIQQYAINTIKATIVTLFIPFDLWVRTIETFFTLLFFVPYEWASGRTESVDHSLKNVFRPLDSWISFKKLIGIKNDE